MSSGSTGEWLKNEKTAVIREALIRVLALDDLDNVVANVLEDRSLFVILEGYVRSSLELVKHAKFLAESGYIYGGHVVARSALESATLSQYLYLSGSGEVESVYKLAKSIRDYQIHNSTKLNKEVLEELQETILKSASNDYSFLSNGYQLCGKFTAKEMLQRLYFHLSQSVHPLSGPTLHFRYNESGDIAGFTRTSIDDDKEFLFYTLLIIAGLAAAVHYKISGNEENFETLSNFCKVVDFDPILKLDK